MTSERGAASNNSEVMRDSFQEPAHNRGRQGVCRNGSEVCGFKMLLTIEQIYLSVSKMELHIQGTGAL